MGMCQGARARRRIHEPAGLRPELVPRVEVVKVLPTVSNPAVLELKDDAAINIQALAASLRAVVMSADHAPLIICKHVCVFAR